MSLDDILASKMAEAKDRKKKKTPKPVVVKSKSSVAIKKVKQPVRLTQNDRPRKFEVSSSNNRPGAQSKGLSVFARIGKPPVSGTPVTFENLKSSVREHDIRELCSAIGEIKEVHFNVGSFGKNTATVLFSRRSEAITCVNNLNGMSLDNAPMEVSIAGEPKPQSVFDRLQGVSANKNVRNGLFGTAMDDDDSTPVSGRHTFAVSLSDSRPQQGKLVQPFSVPAQRPRSGSNANRFMGHDDRMEPTAPRSARGGGGSRGRDRRDGGRKPQQHQKQQRAPAEPKDLDADLDNYFASKK
eukprot:CAMPEP_0170364474 /NCGR_PEP_ID=MMETSP0117_2-20130122/5391_1 /TAXON_ID=400756 /ORGANISM="Durinskia baltica, Strain CSIRO CS-38" /LENGTH=296 /DNA_ID=CAMNT_0010618973 /DNA_START=60 /DNA_END=950 /DNA_ORIENTATION=+